MRRIDFVYWGIIILLIFMMNRCKNEKSVYVTKTLWDTVKLVVHDTVVIQKEKPIYRTKTIYRPEIRYVDSSKFISNVYKDTAVLDLNHYIYYEAFVNGVMNQIELGLYDNRPDSLFTRTVYETITETNYIEKNAWYVGGSVNLDSDVTLGAAYKWKRNFVELGYDFGVQGPRIGYYYQIK